MRSGPFVATEFIGPVICGARHVANHQTDVAGVRPGGHQAQEVAKGPGGREEFVAPCLCNGVLAARGQTEGLTQGTVEMQSQLQEG